MYVVKFKVKYLVKIYLFKIILQFYQNHTPTLPKSHSDFHKITGWFHKITLRLCQNHTPASPKSHSDFHKITCWFSQHHWLIFTKSHSDFVKITLRFSQNHWQIYTRSPRLLFYCTLFQTRTLPHCASCLSEGFSSFVTSLSGSPHCFCPCLFKKPSVVYR